MAHIDTHSIIMAEMRNEHSSLMIYEHGIFYSGVCAAMLVKQNDFNSHSKVICLAKDEIDIAFIRRKNCLILKLNPFQFR